MFIFKNLNIYLHIYVNIYDFWVKILIFRVKKPQKRAKMTSPKFRLGCFFTPSPYNFQRLSRKLIVDEIFKGF